MLEYKNDKWKAILALSPTLLLMLVFTFYPIFNTIITAFMEGYTYGVWTDPSNGAAIGWLDHFGETILECQYNKTGQLIGYTNQYVGIGLGNFATILKDPTFLTAVKNTAVMVFISVPLTVIIGLLISVALNGIKKAQGVFQTIYFLPYVTNSIALGMVFSVLFASRNGLINSVIVSLGGERISWLTPFNGQSPTYFTCMMVLMIYTVWNGLAFKILVFLSGMQSIDKQYYQAAQIDATPRWRVFRRITVPLLSPMIAYILITSLIGAFKAYSSVIAVFNGRFGPRGNEMMLITMVGYTYEKLNVMSNMNQISQASASALILFAIIMAITAVELWVSKKKVHY